MPIQTTLRVHARLRRLDGSEGRPATSSGPLLVPLRPHRNGAIWFAAAAAWAGVGSARRQWSGHGYFEGRDEVQRASLAVVKQCPGASLVSLLHRALEERSVRAHNHSSNRADRHQVLGSEIIAHYSNKALSFVTIEFI